MIEEIVNFISWLLLNISLPENPLLMISMLYTRFNISINADRKRKLRKKYVIRDRVQKTKCMCS